MPSLIMATYTNIHGKTLGLIPQSEIKAKSIALHCQSEAVFFLDGIIELNPKSFFASYVHPLRKTNSNPEGFQSFKTLNNSLLGE